MSVKMKKWLLMWLMVLIPFQAVMAAVIDQQLHKTADEHIFISQNLNSAEGETVGNITENDNSTKVQYHSSHCSHFHADAQLFTPIGEGFIFALYSLKPIEYNFKNSSIYLLPKLRPPIV